MIPLTDCPGMLARPLDFGILPSATLFESYRQEPNHLLFIDDREIRTNLVDETHLTKIQSTTRWVRFRELRLVLAREIGFRNVCMPIFDELLKLRPRSLCDFLA